MTTSEKIGKILQNEFFMGVSRSGVITMLNYLKNCVGTSPQCPIRAHQESIYEQFFANFP